MSLRSRPSVRSKNVLGVLTQAPAASSSTTTTTTSSSPRNNNKRFSFLYTLLNPKSRQWQAVLFKKIIPTVIVLDLITFILETDHAFKEYQYIFRGMETISSTIFLLEYLARVWTCVERPKYQGEGPLVGRLRFMMTGAAIIDGISTLPWFLEQVLERDLPRLSYLRFFRILRITKTQNGMRAIDAVYRVTYYNREILFVAAFVCIGLVTGTGVALYYLRPPDDGIAGEGADENFNSIPRTMYMSTLMLTGQGGPGLEGDLPWYTKSVVLMTSIVSVAMFAIPGAMFTWGFEAEAERMAKRAATLKKRQEESIRNGNGELNLSDDDYSTDEEYQKIIAGEEEEDDDDDGEGVWPKELLEKFQSADGDGDGALTLKEFVELSTQSMRNMKKKNSSSGSIDDDSPVLTGLMCRVQQLERDTKANSDKLDKILELLESKKDK